MKKEIKRKLRTDKALNSKRSYYVLKFYRLQHQAYIEKSKTKLLFYSIVKEIVFFFLRLDAQISYKAYIGENIRLPHCAQGVVISAKAHIENNQTIYHQVTIGINENLREELQRIVIHENCYMSCGCKIISCEVGKNTKIGPNAVVYQNIPEGSLYVNSGIIIKK